MSHTTQPITPARFASALPALPLSTLHETAAQTRNSITHLLSSNAELRPHADDEDGVCKEALAENEVVIERMRGRLVMLKAEVEGRGFLWVEDETGIEKERVIEVNSGMNGRVNGGFSGGVNGRTNGEQVVGGSADSRTDQAVGRTADSRTDHAGVGHAVNGHRSNGSGRLTDEELRRRLEEQMGGLDGDEEGGMHL